MNAITPTPRYTEGGPKPRRVLIGTPSMDGKLEARYVDSLAKTVRLCAAQGLDVREVFLCYDAILPNLRNSIVRVALENGFDDLVMIDADIDWKPEWVPKLLSYPLDCVGGTYRKKTDAEIYEVRGKFPLGPLDGLQPVDGLGAGFLRLSRRALQMLWDSSEPYQCRDEPPTRYIFEYQIVNGHHVGEDSVLCRKLKALGMGTFFDPAMTCGHTGMKRWAGDFEAWHAQASDAAQTLVKQATV